MFGLILETSTEKGCIVLSKGDEPLASLFLPGGAELSKTLASQTAQLLQKHLPPSQKLDFIAVGTGPGSYTGLRVGASLGKALSFGWKIPILGFCSLLAYFPKDPTSCAVVCDARIGGFYVLESPSASPLLIAPDAAKETLARFTKIGSPHPKTLQKRLDLPVDWIETNPDPQLLASIGFSLFLQKEEAPITLAYLSGPPYNSASI